MWCSSTKLAPSYPGAAGLSASRYGERVATAGTVDAVPVIDIPVSRIVDWDTFHDVGVQSSTSR